MARHTSLYQAPRSPLIQGRTRWDRPLWQAWLGGALITVVLLVAVLYVRTAGQGARFVVDAALGWLVLGVVVGSAIGAVLGRFWGWRARWLAASFCGALLGVALYGAQAWIAVLGGPPGLGG